MVEYKENWTNLDDFILVRGIFTHGYDSWKEILEDKILWGFNSDPFEAYKTIFHKIEKLPNDEKEIDQNFLKTYKITKMILILFYQINNRYVLYFLQNRANNILLYLLERETLRDEVIRKKKDNLSEAIQELKSN